MFVLLAPFARLSHLDQTSLAILFVIEFYQSLSCLLYNIVFDQEGN